MTFFNVENSPNPLNSVQMVGRLQRQPFVNNTQSGRKVARVLLVTQRPGRGGAAFVGLVDWGDDWGASQSNPKSREGEVLDGLETNTPVRVQGELVSSAYTPEGGSTIYRVEIDVRALEVLTEEQFRAYTQQATVTALT